MFNYQKLLNLFIEYIVFTARGCVYFEGIKTATIIGCQGIRYGPSGRILRPKNTTVRPKFRRGSQEDIQFFKCTPVTVTHVVHSLKYIASCWCVNLAWSYLPGRRLSTYNWTLSIYKKLGLPKHLPGTSKI